MIYFFLNYFSVVTPKNISASAPLDEPVASLSMLSPAAARGPHCDHSWFCFGVDFELEEAESTGSCTVAAGEGVGARAGQAQLEGIKRENTFRG